MEENHILRQKAQFISVSRRYLVSAEHQNGKCHNIITIKYQPDVDLFLDVAGRKGVKIGFRNFPFVWYKKITKSKTFFANKKITESKCCLKLTSNVDLLSLTLTLEAQYKDVEQFHTQHKILEIDKIVMNRDLHQIYFRCAHPCTLYPSAHISSSNCSKVFVN